MKKYFLTGLVILLPVALTIAIVSFLINFFTGPFVEMVTESLQKMHVAEHGFLFLSPEKAIEYLSKLLILICLFFVIVVLGMLTRWYLVRALLKVWDFVLQKIPVVSTVYKTTKEIIKTVFTSNTSAFKQVVMVPFPRKDIYALGLISGDSPTLCSSSLGSSLVSVLIPTTPNPTSGFLLMYKKEDLIYLDMKPDEAIKYIVSCGVLTPREKRLR